MPEFNAHLWVEGDNDRHVVWALCKAYQVAESFDVRKPTSNDEGDGIEAALRAFHYSLIEPGKQVVGLVIDADEQVDQRWQQAADIILRTNRDYVLPPSPDPQGTIIPTPNNYSPRLGVWLMPNNQQTGMLEDFAAFLIPESDKLRPFANRVLDEIETANLNPYRPQYHSKAYIHTWLAWQKNPGMPMGQAITAEALSVNSPIAVTFVTWLNNLFNLEP